MSERRLDVTRGLARVDVLIIGAGQAGLRVARALQAAGVQFCLYERHARIGDSWRRRFDSLTLFSSREMSSLPGLPQAGDPAGYPGRNEMGDYLERYAERLHAPLVTNQGIQIGRAAWREGGWHIGNE